MEAIGMLLAFGGVLAFFVTGLGCVRSQQAFVDSLKSNHQKEWSAMGKPEIKMLDPFKTHSLQELIFSSKPDLGNNPELMRLHKKARFWFISLGMNFAVVFLGMIVGATS